MAETDVPATPPSPRPPRLFTRVGAVLADPFRALTEIDRWGGGVRDAAWLVLLGIVCFHLADLVRTLMGIAQSSLATSLRQLMALASQEVREALIIALPAGLAITVLAGRGRRDPSMDIELGAACYVPFFAVRATFRTLDLDAFLGPLSPAANQLVSGLALAWALVVLAFGVRVARRRTAHRQPGAMVADLPADSSGERRAPRWPGRVYFAATALAIVLAGALSTSATWMFSNVETIRPLAKGQPAPPFDLPRIDGVPGKMSLTDLKGKAVVLDFWATWCAPCVQMLPTLHALHRQWQSRGMELVGINSDGPASSLDDLRSFLRERPAGYPMVVDDGSVGTRYNVVALPHLVVIDKNGLVHKIFWGTTSQAELADAIRQALQ